MRLIYSLLLLCLIAKTRVLAQEDKAKPQLEYSLEIGASFPVFKSKSSENPLSYEKEGVGGNFRLAIPVFDQWILSLRAGGMNYVISDELSDALFDSLKDDYYIDSSLLPATYHTSVGVTIGYRLEIARGSLIPEVSAGLNFIELEGSSGFIKRKGSNEQYRVSLNRGGKTYTDAAFSLGTRLSYPLIKSGRLSISVTPQFLFARERLDIVTEFEGLGGKTRTYPRHFTGTLTAFAVYAGIGYKTGGCCGLF